MKNILLVDDESYFAALITELLKKLDYNAKFIDNPQLVFDVLEFEKIDLILLDYYMPDQNGLETLKLIKSNPLYSNIPVIIFTSETEKEILSDFLEAGASDFLNKGVDLVELKARVASAIKIADLNKLLKAQLEISRKKDEEINKFKKMILNDFKQPIEKLLKFCDGNDSLQEVKIISEDLLFKVNNTIDLVRIMKEET